MKKRTALIGAILSLIPISQPLLFKTGIALSSFAVILFVPETVFANSADFYFDRARKKSDSGDFYGAISDYSKAIEIDPFFSLAYVGRSIQKEKLGDLIGACKDAKNAVSTELKNLNKYKQIKKDRNSNWLKENQTWIKEKC
tara:strand:- start:79 stop:504 length:426 start_codon:yes stop_codon:yes gene_type:complete